MLKLRTLLIAGVILCSTVMCTTKERNFPGRGPAEDGAGQGGEAGAGGGQAGSEGGEANFGGEGGDANVGGDTNAGGAGAEAGEAAGGTSAGGTTAAGAGQGGALAGGGSSGAAGSGCPSASSRCVPVAPAGWQGPLLVTANSVNTCPSGFPTKSPALSSGLLVGSASCACNCGATQVTCGGTASTTFYQNTGCSISVHGQTTTEGACRQESSAISISFSGQPTATCNAAVVQPSLPSPTWGQTMNACGGAQAQGTCSASGEVCVANPSAPFATKYCIARAGDQACPSAYSVRSVLFAGYTDTRACPSSCSCTASGQECALQVDAHTTADCSGSYNRKTIPSSGSTCVISDPAIHRATYATRVVTKPGTCSTTSTLTATGSVTESGPNTLCCTE